MDELGQRIDQLLAIPPYGLPPEARQAALVELLKDELEYAASRNPAYQNYLRHWPTDMRSAERVADLPYLPVGYLKGDVSFFAGRAARDQANPDFELHDRANAQQDCPGFAHSQAHDEGSRRHRARLHRFGPKALSGGRCARLRGGGPELGARGAAIQGLQPFASEVTYCLKPGSWRPCARPRQTPAICRSAGVSRRCWFMALLTFFGNTL